MTFEIILLFSILAIAVILFVTEVIRLDLTAMLVMLALVFTGLVRPEQALSGFSNPAVITIWAMFILSAGLTRTGVSTMIGAKVLQFARQGEARLIAVLMTVTALLSAFMNNVGVASMFLPITMEISRRTGRPASRLLLPMAYGSLLGGLILLIGTSSNLVVRDVMREAGYTPISMFDFTPGGLIILVVSVLYMALIGRRFLPVRQTPQPLSASDPGSNGAASQYSLDERMALLIVPDKSSLVGKTLTDSRIGRALGLNILSIQRKDGSRITAEPQTHIEGGDRLLVLGRLERIDEISQKTMFTLVNNISALERMLTADTGLAAFDVTGQSLFTGKTIAELRFRQEYGVNLLAIRQGGIVRRTNLADLKLNPGDRLLLHGPIPKLEAFSNEENYHQPGLSQVEEYHLDERLLCMEIPEGSPLDGRTLADSRLGAAFGLTVLSICRGDGEGDSNCEIPSPNTPLKCGDQLIVGGRPQDIEVLRGLQNVIVERDARVSISKLEDAPGKARNFQIVEVMISPYSSLAGKTLSQIQFRERFNLSVLAIWRGERAYRTGLGDFKLQNGDALLCYGEQERFKTLARDRDFVVLKMDLQEKPRIKKAPISALIMLGVIISAIAFGIPISIAALTGCVLMVLSGALTMDEMYQSISWRAIFLIAAMMPLGIAMQNSGAAEFVGGMVVQLLGSYGPTVTLIGLLVTTIVTTQFMPSAVIAVVMIPIALTTTANMGINHMAFVMALTYTLAASFLSPVAHPANVMVMSPGGYRFTDYIKHGLPISIIVIVVSVLFLPVIFPY